MQDVIYVSGTVSQRETVNKVALIVHYVTPPPLVLMMFLLLLEVNANDKKCLRQLDRRAPQRPAQMQMTPNITDSWTQRLRSGPRQIQMTPHTVPRQLDPQGSAAARPEWK